MFELTLASRQGTLLTRSASDPARAIHVAIDMIMAVGVLRDGDALFIRSQAEKAAPLPRARMRIATDAVSVSDDQQEKADQRGDLDKLDQRDEADQRATAPAAAPDLTSQQAVAEAAGSDVPPRDAAERLTFAQAT